MTVTASAARRGPSDGSTRNVGAEAHALVQDVVKLADHLGEVGAVEALKAQAVNAGTTATVVVAGEAKQGKSSLVNALVGVEGLSPVDPDIATAAPLRFAYGPELAVTLSLTDGEHRRIDPGETATWASLAVAPMERLRRVSGVDVEVPSPLLQPGVVLIDTPGVGGLVAGHAQMTLRALEHATAMLFVTDADTKLTRPELEFLARASERIAAVVFVITKIDATPDWQAVVAENREVLARWAPRFADAPMVPVSTRLALRSRALATDDRPLAADLWVESGLAQVQEIIAKRIKPVATTLAVANTVASSRATLARLGVVAERTRSAASADPAVIAAFEAEKARVAKLRADQQGWATVLEKSLFNARQRLRNQVKTSADQVRSAGQDLVRTRVHKPQQIVAQIDAELDSQAQELSIALDATGVSICRELFERIELDGPLQLSVSEVGDVDVKPFGPSATRGMDLLSGGMAGVTGFSLVSRLSSAGTVVALVGPSVVLSWLPVAGALVGGYAIHHIRSGAARRNELGQWIRGEVDRAASERYADIERALTTAKFDIADVVRAGLSEREREVSAALEEARAARSRSEKERVERERATQRVIRAVEQLSERADELLDVLLRAAMRSAPNGTPPASSGGATPRLDP